MPKRFAAFACVSFSRSIQTRRASASLARNSMTCASWGGKPRSRKILPLDSVTFLVMVRSLGEFARYSVAIPRQFQVRTGCLPGLFLERMQNVHCVFEPGDIYHPERAGLIPHPNLSRA